MRWSSQLWTRGAGGNLIWNKDLNELNFLWTQWKVNSELDKLPSKIPKPVKPLIDEHPSEEENEGEGWKIILSSKYMQKFDLEHNLPRNSTKLYNRIEWNYNLTNKKTLFFNMKSYYESLGEDPFNILPLTFHVKGGSEDPEFQNFKKHFDEQKEIWEKNNLSNNVWIIKPGENSNRGGGISVSNNLEEIKELLNTFSTVYKRTWILQKYIEKPLLINKRKFDIRVFTLFTCYNQGYVKGYFYKEGYLRTSCKEFSLDDLEDNMIHLTNDAVQK